MSLTLCGFLWGRFCPQEGSQRSVQSSVRGLKNSSLSGRAEGTWASVCSKAQNKPLAEGGDSQTSSGTLAASARCWAGVIRVPAAGSRGCCCRQARGDPLCLWPRPPLPAFFSVVLVLKNCWGTANLNSEKVGGVCERGG